MAHSSDQTVPFQLEQSMTLQPDSPHATLHLFHVKLRSILGAETTFKQKLAIKFKIAHKSSDLQLKVN